MTNVICMRPSAVPLPTEAPVRRAPLRSGWQPGQRIGAVILSASVAQHFAPLDDCEELVLRLAARGIASFSQLSGLSRVELLRASGLDFRAYASFTAELERLGFVYG